MVEKMRRFCLLSGRGNSIFSVQSARSKQRRVQSVLSVGRHYNLDICGLVEAVHLVEQLQQDPLHLSICPCLRIKSLGCDRVDLVDEDDGGGVLLGEAEDVSHHARAFTKVLLHKLASNNPDEAGSGMMSNSFSQHGLATARGAVHQHTSRWVDSNLFVQVKVEEGKLHCFSHLLLLHVHTTNVRVADVRLLISSKHRN